MISLMGLLSLFMLVVVARALFTGRLGFGGGTIHRADDPAQFWTMTAIDTAMILVFPWLALRYAHGRPPRPDELSPIHLSLAAVLAFWLIRFLVTGTASIASIPFSRGEEPIQYWLLVGATIVALSLTLWQGFGFVGLGA